MPLKKYSLFCSIALFCNNANCEQYDNKSHKPIIKIETIIANQFNPNIKDIPITFISALNDIGQSRADSASAHTFLIQNHKCAKTLNAQVEINAKRINNGAANDRIGFYINGIAIEGTQSLWGNKTPSITNKKIYFILSDIQMKSIDKLGRLTVIIQDDTQVDGLKLTLKRQFNDCDNKLS